MTSAAFRTALQATGYLDPHGRPAPGLTRAGADTPARLRTVLQDNRVGLRAEAVFSSQGASTSIFKDAGEVAPSAADLIGWYEAAWNVGVARLLWVVTPTDVRLYNCYAAPPDTPGDSEPPELERFSLDRPDRIRSLDAACGRLITETGAFWSSTIVSKINRGHRVDRELLAEISALENRLVALTPADAPASTRSLARDLAQRFIGRCIFTWYLLDRQLAQPFLPDGLPMDLSEMFSTPEAAFHLFGWLRSTFNGDLFPMDDPGAEREHLSHAHLDLIWDFVKGRSLIPERKGQGRLFWFRFNAIPVDLISSIYQQFARSSAADEAAAQGLHYTPVELVHLTLDPVFEHLPTDARIVDSACGSGAFLVEAFRRLVWRASRGKPAFRRLVRDILYGQLFGVDINGSALGIAAFSLYLAALELDEDPIQDLADLKFDHLIGRALFEADSLSNELPSELTEKPFGAVVGNLRGLRWSGWVLAETDQGGQRNRPPTAEPRLGILGPCRSPCRRWRPRWHGDEGDAVLLQGLPRDRRQEQPSSTPCSRRADQSALPSTRGAVSRRHGSGSALPCEMRALGVDDRLLVGSIPWTPDFRRTSVFHIGPGEIRSIPLDRILAVRRF